jgi:hypothetical protein
VRRRRTRRRQEGERISVESVEWQLWWALEVEALLLQIRAMYDVNEFG